MIRDENRYSPRPALLQKSQALTPSETNAIVQEAVEKVNGIAIRQLMDKNAPISNISFIRICSTFPELIDAALRRYPDIARSYLKNIERNDFFENENTIRTLIEKGVDTLTEAGTYRRLFTLCYKEGRAELIDKILATLAESHQKEVQNLLRSLDLETEMTPLQHAITTQQTQLVEVLTKYCAIDKEIDSKENTALHYAVKTSNLEYIDSLTPLQQGRARDLPNKDGTTPIMLAASLGNLDVVQRLLDHGAATDQVDHSGNTFLHYASMGGNAQIVAIALEKNININEKNSTGSTPLLIAAERGHLSVATLLIQHGADPFATDDTENTFLHAATAGGNITLIECALGYCSDINQRNLNETPPLFIAAERGFYSATMLLLNNDANPHDTNENQETFLHMCAKGGNLQLIECALNYNCDVNALDEGELSPLFVAARHGHYDAVLMLVQHGAQLDHQDDFQNTFLHEAAQGGNCKIITYACQNGCEVNARNDDGYTPLLIAAQKGHYDAVLTLMTHRAKRNISNNYGDSFLHAAAEGGHPNIIEWALSCETHPTMPNNDNTSPLQIAASKGHKDAVRALIKKADNAILNTIIKKTLLDAAAQNGNPFIFTIALQIHGAIDNLNNDIIEALLVAASKGHTTICRIFSDDVDWEGNSLLHHAVINKDTKAIELLLTCGYNVELRNHHGRTPLYFAALAGHPEVVTLLLNAGAQIDVVDNYQNTILHAAAIGNHPDIIKLAMLHELDIGAANFSGNSPIQLAALHSSYEVMQLLTELGANQDLSISVKSILRGAIQKHEYETIHRILKPRAQTLRGNDGKTLLLRALRLDNPQQLIDSIRNLIEHGMDPYNVDGLQNSLFHYAIMYQKPSVIVPLYTAGCDVTKENNVYQTPFRMALELYASAQPNEKMNYLNCITAILSIYITIHNDEYMEYMSRIDEHVIDRVPQILLMNSQDARMRVQEGKATSLCKMLLCRFVRSIAPPSMEDALKNLESHPSLFHIAVTLSKIIQAHPEKIQQMSTMNTTALEWLLVLPFSPLRRALFSHLTMTQKNDGVEVIGRKYPELFEQFLDICFESDKTTLMSLEIPEFGNQPLKAPTELLHYLTHPHVQEEYIRRREASDDYDTYDASQVSLKTFLIEIETNTLIRNSEELSANQVQSFYHIIKTALSHLILKLQTAEAEGKLDPSMVLTICEEMNVAKNIGASACIHTSIALYNRFCTNGPKTLKARVSEKLQAMRDTLAVTISQESVEKEKTNYAHAYLVEQLGQELQLSYPLAYRNMQEANQDSGFEAHLPEKDEMRALFYRHYTPSRICAWIKKDSNDREFFDLLITWAKNATTHAHGMYVLLEDPETGLVNPYTIVFLLQQLKIIKYREHSER